MEINSTNTEQAILDAAEKLFLDKGFAATKTTAIATAAGVNHAMLHYYFRTKENLFNQIFEKKVALFLTSFDNVFDTEMPFIDKIKLAVEKHFDFIGTNPKLPMFIFREIISDHEKRDSIIKKVIPKGTNTFNQLTKELELEINKGNINSVSPLDLILNVASLNVFAYISAQVIFGDLEEDKKAIEHFLSQRRTNNIEVIIKSLTK